MKISAKEQAERLRELRSWLGDAGVTLNKVEAPEPGVAHHLTFTFPPQGGNIFHLVRPEARGLTVLASGTTVSPQHLQILQSSTTGLRQHVVLMLRRAAFPGGVVGFAPKMEGDLVTNWQLDVEVYDDGLTQHSFFAALRMLLSKHLELIDAFNEALGAKPVVVASGATGSSGYV